MTVHILMGVAGCGKSTVGRAAAKSLGIPFLEGDDFHPEINVTKMAGGVALTDDDRMPWVEAMIEGCNKNDSSVLACSALSKTVRRRLRDGLKTGCQFIYLHGDQDTLARRLSDRKGHFFKSDLLASQFSALDVPQDVATLDITQSVENLAKQVCEIIQSESQTLKK